MPRRKDEKNDACPMKHSFFPIVETEQLLKHTTSRCPICHASCPAEVWRVAGRPAKVFLKRACPQHGEASVCIASDARFYWLAKGNPDNASRCCGGSACRASDGSTAGTLGRNAAGRGDAPFEQLSTCLALIEIVNSCNLSCPTCYADSPPGPGHKVDAVPLEAVSDFLRLPVFKRGHSPASPAGSPHTSAGNRPSYRRPGTARRP